MLHDVSITVEPGKTLALIGPSGGGKTTMSQLLMRFYDVNSGAVLVDGNDVRDLTQASLRQNIGMIQQDVYMFAGTVRENIRYGRPDATDEEIIQAAKLAEIHNEITEMPDGYDSYIGERGVMLSGGQKQRISIARVFLKNPPILILDEATSGLDVINALDIRKTIRRLSKEEGMSFLLSSHNMLEIEYVSDRVGIMAHGQLMVTGTIDELKERYEATNLEEVFERVVMTDEVR